MKLRAFPALLLTAALFPLTACADTYDSITVDGTTNAGDTFTVGINVYSDESIGYMQTSVEYDDSVIEYVGGDAVGGGGFLTLNAFPVVSPDTVECQLTFVAVGEGDCTVSLSNGYVFSTDGIVLSQPSAVAYVHVDDYGGEYEETGSPDESLAVPSPEYTEENDSSAETEAVTPSTEEEPEHQASSGTLSDLSCTAGLLTPAFSPDVFEYTVYAAYSAESAQLSGTASDDNDVISYTGSDELAVGSNLRTVTVTSADGSSTVYTVNVIRAASDESGSDEKKVNSAPASTINDIYKDTLNPALGIILVTLVVALFIVLYWLRGLFKKK